MSIAWSFSKLQRESRQERSQSPSPDNYDTLPGMRVTKDRSPEWSFSRSGRKGSNERNPGPGQYDGDINKLKMNISYTMGLKGPTFSPEKNSQRYDAPGPGSYQPILKNKQPTYSMGTKRNGPKTFNTPGPGQYESGKKKHQQSKTQFTSPFGAKSKRDSSFMQSSVFSPGPCSYQPKNDYVKYRNPTAKISKGMTAITSRDLSPGPGSYQYSGKDLSKSMRKVTMGSRPQTAKVRDGPGPGQYNYDNKTIKESSKRGISAMRNKSEKVLSLSKDKVSSPGPGAYNANVNAIKEQVRNYGFGKVKRNNFIDKDQKSKPGPGQYNAQPSKSTRSFKIGHKLNPKTRDNAPGPGNYEPNANFVKESTRNVKISNSPSPLSHSMSVSQMPGPGSYNDGREFGKNVQCYTMRGRPVDQQRNDSPAPGQYDPKDHQSKERIPSATIKSGSKRDKDFAKTQSALGPGQYNDQSKSFGKNVQSFTFTSRHQDKIDKNSPGPGNYDASDALVKYTNPSYKYSQSQRQQHISKDAKSHPGPGQYISEHKSFGKDVVSYTIGRRGNEQKREMSPGPGAYNEKYEQVKEGAKNFKISIGQRPDIAPKTARGAPGPGQYEGNKIGYKSPQYSMNSKRDELRKDNNPGPGTYDATHKLNKEKSPSYRWGNSERSKAISKEHASSPGPGNYDQQTTIGKNTPQYSFQAKHEYKVLDQKPGPGSYDANGNYVKERVQTYQWGKGQRQELVSKEVSSMPGPGGYESPSKLGKDCPNYTIGGRSKSRQDEQSPGPGTYEPRDYLTKDNSRVHGISKSARKDDLSHTKDMPGPGQYANYNEFGKECKSFQFRGRPEDKVRNDSPGPGIYEGDPNKIKERVISHKMSKSCRGELVSKEMTKQPGPGEYDSPTRLGKDAPSVSIRGRQQDNVRNDSPGPGNYNGNENYVKEKVQSYKWGNGERGQLVNKEQSSQPGPGIYEYHSTLGKNAQSYTIGTKFKDQEYSKNPGPGQYDAKDYLTKDQTGQNSYKWSQSQRQQITAKEESSKPGPGCYADQKPFYEDTRSFKFKGRPQDKVGNDMPGPGNYDGDYSCVKERVVAYKMSASGSSPNRGDIVSRERSLSPGPGHYDSPSKVNGPNYTMQGRPGTAPRSNAPGPGQYEANDSPTRYQSPGYSFHDKSMRSTSFVSGDKTSMPGPGIYEQASSFGKSGPLFSMRGKGSPERADDRPGPGNYDAKHDLVKDKTQSSFRIGKNKRDFLSISNDSLGQPGPGQYDQKHGNHGPSYSMGGRQSPGAQQDKPGPGSYDANGNFVKYQSPSAKFSGSPDRSRSSSPRKDEKPGPGQYDARDYELSGHYSLSYSFPKGEPREGDGGYPGPGHYKIPCKIADVPSYSHTVQDPQFRYV